MTWNGTGAPEQLIAEADGTIVELDGPNGDGIRAVGGYGLNALNGDGTVDTTFGVRGAVAIKPGERSIFQGRTVSLVQQPDGQLLVTQATDLSPGQPHGVKVSRYSKTGTLDRTFGTAGTQTLIATAPISDTGNGITIGAVAALDRSGRLYLAGGSQGPAFFTKVPNLYAIDTNNDAGRITGSMFYDANGNGKRDAGEHPLNWTCYVDVDNDGKYDNADMKVSTNAAGEFTIANLTPGVYHIRQSQVSHWQKTTPAEYTVAVTQGKTTSGITFGSQLIG